MNLVSDDFLVSRDAARYVRNNRLLIQEKILGGIETNVSDKGCIHLYMAGSPGAGKTEISKALVAELSQMVGGTIVRIDPDDIRTLLPGYKGENAHLFQNAVTIAVTHLLMYLYAIRVSFILDGTLAACDKARHNIDQSLACGATPFILYVYQEPGVAWKLTQAREKVEHRRILPDSFVSQLFGCREVIKELRGLYDNRIRVMAAVKDFTNPAETRFISDVGNIDEQVPIPYSREEVASFIASGSWS